MNYYEAITTRKEMTQELEHLGADDELYTLDSAVQLMFKEPIRMWQEGLISCVELYHILASKLATEVK